VSSGSEQGVELTLEDLLNIIPRCQAVGKRNSMNILEYQGGRGSLFTVYNTSNYCNNYCHAGG